MLLLNVFCLMYFLCQFFFSQSLLPFIHPFNVIDRERIWMKNYFSCEATKKKKRIGGGKIFLKPQTKIKRKLFEKPWKARNIEWKVFGWKKKKKFLKHLSAFVVLKLGNFSRENYNTRVVKNNFQVLIFNFHLTSISFA